MPLINAFIDGAVYGILFVIFLLLVYGVLHFMEWRARINLRKQIYKQCGWGNPPRWWED
ncbi:MAG: hypothetical protein KA204_01480 [Chromatiaceae bacterium]|nr:hypothetical protein [Chromatiaceae bacterium]MBP6734068.1 hypothetical protein [Chromatiaceae bacterium]MBP8289368.1 hypothetical protein [Chromatiaceae bacterium]